MTIEDIASVCHDANWRYCFTLGDNSQTCWPDSPKWQKQSAINGVKFHLANPDAGPSGSHENWMKEKLADGWKHGPVKDVDKKEHPCMVPYEQLPPEQKMKDAIFVAIVNAMNGGL